MDTFVLRLSTKIQQVPPRLDPPTQLDCAFSFCISLHVIFRFRWGAGGQTSFITFSGSCSESSWWCFYKRWRWRREWRTTESSSYWSKRRRCFLLQKVSSSHGNPLDEFIFRDVETGLWLEPMGNIVPAEFTGHPSWGQAVPAPRIGTRKNSGPVF